MPGTNESRPSSEQVLAELLAQAKLPGPIEQQRLLGRGFDHEISVLTFAGGQRLVLRRLRKERPPEHGRAAVLAHFGISAPALIASVAHGSLFEFIPGRTLGDLIEDGTVTKQDWRAVGETLRHLHAVRFPNGIGGRLRPGGFELTRDDPVTDLRTRLDEMRPGLEKLDPSLLPQLDRLAGFVTQLEGEFREPAPALVHGDIYIHNIMLTPGKCWLIDWDDAAVGEAVRELSILEKFTWLFGGKELPDAFWEGYGPNPNPRTFALHRVIQRVSWAMSGDWAHWDAVEMPDEQRAYVHQWERDLVAYTRELPAHVAELQALLQPL